MKRPLYLLVSVCALLLIGAPAHGQCVQITIATGKATQCSGTLSVMANPGDSPTAAVQFTAATDAFPCPPGAPGSPSLCFDTKDNLTVDKGAGATVLGEQGPPGVNGANGTNGKDGLPGTAATVSVGTVTTLPAGSPATVTNFGSSTSAILEFGIPQGVAGPAGTMPKSFTCSTSVKNRNGSTTLSGCAKN